MEDKVTYDVKEAPFELFGYAKECFPERLIRVPREIAEKTSEKVLHHSQNTSGIRVRFSTDSEFIAIKVRSSYLHLMGHMSCFGSAGFDLYTVYENGRSEYFDLFKPGNVKDTSKFVDGYECIIKTFSDGKMHSYQINFPLYSRVDGLTVSLAPGARLEKGVPYRPVKPFVLYGSSITQGACASRPGNCHAAIASRRLNVDFRNLGFSGACRGEAAIVDYVASRDASVFVLEYDHNSPLPELRERHARTAYRIREKNPDTPFILATRPDYYGTEEDKARRETVLSTYGDLVKQGDKNVYFLDGAEMYSGPERKEFTVDRVHPNDAGCFRIADALTPLLKTIYEGQGVI